MTISYLNADEVLLIHEHAIREFGGGSLGLINKDRLEAALAAPQQAMFGQELYPDLCTKAGILIFLLIKGHPFSDGNKRTGLFALFEFLERNGLTIDVPSDELYRFTLDIATSVLDKDQIAAWLRERTVPYLPTVQS